MPFDRDDTLKKAEKLLRQGRLDAAIAEYVRVVEDQPRDWATVNALGDLYVRAGQNEKAAAQYLQIAEHFMREGFYPKAGALYKKLLKLTPDDEAAQLQLAEISTRQGLLVDAKSYLNAVASRRRARGDRTGAAEIVVRLGSLDPADFDARLAAARTLAEMGDEENAARRFREAYDDLVEKGKAGEALQALREAVRLNPADSDGRAVLARAAIEAGDLDGARTYLDRQTAGDDPALLMALLDIELRSGQLEPARELLPQLLGKGRDFRHKVIDLAWAMAGRNADAAFLCVDAAVDAASAASEFDDAAGVLQEFITRVPHHIPALLKLIEACVDGGLEAAMYEAQAQLTDAYLSSGQAAEARVIAEDLVAREPWERVHIERFRRALVMLKVPEPDTHIAERLSGQAPFTATDPFVDAAPGQRTEHAPTPLEEPEQGERPGEAAPAASVEPAPRAVPPPAQPAVAGPARAARAPEAPAPHGGEIDLTSALGDLFVAPSTAARPAPPAGIRDNLEDVFDDLRVEVARQAGTDQAAHFMTLARTYLQMGMEDEAMGPLADAARSTRQRFEAASALGRIYMKRGEVAQAAEWLERASEAPAPTEEEGRAVLYDFGAMLESLGETARALAVFLELQADAGDYRDVAARADRLARVQTGG